MSEINYVLNGDTLPPPKFIPSPTGPIIIFGSYNTRGFFHSERVFKNFGDLPPSSHLATIHLKNVSLDGRNFTRQLKKLDVSRLTSIILENVSLDANSKFLGVELPSLKKYVLQVSHSFGGDGGRGPSSGTSKEVISASDILSLLFFERAKCKRIYSWKADPQFELDKDIKIMFNNLLHFETRLQERLLYTCADPSEGIISMYNQSHLAKIVLHRLDANSCILKRILPACLKFLELTSMSWDQVEYFITNDCTSLEELVFGSFCSKNGPFAPTAVTMRISTLPKTLKRLSVSVVGLWISNPSFKYALDTLTIHNSKLESTFKDGVLEKLAPKRLLFLGNHKFLGVDFLSKLLQDDRVVNLYVESECVDWDGDGSNSGIKLKQFEENEAMEKLQNFIQTQKRSPFETFYSGLGPPYPVFLERERFSNPFAYLTAPNPGKERWIMREGFCGENIWVKNSYQGFSSDDQRRWRDPVTRTEEMEDKDKDGSFSLKYANIETQTEIQLRLVDVWKSDLDIKNMKRVDLIGFTMMEEEIGQLFEQVGSNLETLVFENIRVSRAEPQHPKLSCEPGFSPRSYIPMDLGSVPTFVKNLTLTNTWAAFGSEKTESNLPRDLGGLCLIGKLDATFWTLNLCKYFTCKVLVLNSTILKDKDKIWWDPVTPELLTEAEKTGANFILVCGYKNTNPSHKLRHMNGYAGWERDFLLAKEEYSTSFACIRLDSKVTLKLLGFSCAGKFKELEDNCQRIVNDHEESKKVRAYNKPELQPSTPPPFELDYRLESEMLPDDNKWPKKIKPVEFFGFGIYSKITRLTSIYMYNVKIQADNFLQQLSRRDLDTSGLERIEILCTHLDGKFPDSVTQLDFPVLKKFVFKLRSNFVMDIISLGGSKYSTWKDIQRFFFFTKNGKQILPENLLQLGIDLEISYFDEKIFYYNFDDGKLICALENYNQILEDHFGSVSNGPKLVTLGIKSNIDLIHKFPLNLRSLFLDVPDLAWDKVEVLISDLPFLESLYFHGQPDTVCTLKKLPVTLKSLEIASRVSSVQNVVIDFELETPVHLDFFSLSGCTFARPEVRYELSSFIPAKKYRIDCDDFFSVATGYKLISILLREADKLGIEEISWINRNYNDIPETKDERWEQCRREEKDLSWQEFEEIEVLVGMAEGEMDKSGGTSSSRSKPGSSSSFGQVISVTDVDGQSYKDWLQLSKNLEDGKWKGKKLARAPALEEVWFTSEISFDSVGKWTMKLIELNLDSLM